MKDYSRYNSTPVKGGVRSYNFNSRQQHTPVKLVTPSSPSVVPVHVDVVKPIQADTNPSHQPLLTKSSPSGGEESTSTCATSSMNENLPDSEVNHPQEDLEANSPKQQQQQSRFPPAAVVIDTNQATQQQHPKGNSPTSANVRNAIVAPRANSRIPAPTATSSSSPSATTRNVATTTLTASDALSVRRDGVEATISKLRGALDDASSHDATSKAALAKSDAVILELRSSLRQLKRQLDKVQSEKAEAQSKLKQAYQDLTESQQQARQEITVQSRKHQLELQQLHQQLVDLSNAHNKEERVGELQVQLDRAHAQILTADMVRKELEDTLEAEQYTWELRVQDQERTIQQLQQDCTNLAEELTKYQTQFKEQENHWNQQVQELQERLQQHQQMSHNNSAPGYHPSDEVEAMKEKIAELEQERGELQSCLDEALQELEAVDAEMQGNWQGEREQLLEENNRLQQQLADSVADAVEPLQHLYRWLLEREGMEDLQHHQLPNDVRELMDRIKGHLDQYDQNNNNNERSRSIPQQQDGQINEQLDSAIDQVRDLEAQLSVYRGDLRAREESSAELRASLKEAVALLKPLQDAVAKSEHEKQELQQYIMHFKENPSDEESDEHIKRVTDELAAKTKEVQRLQHQVHSLEVQLAETKEISAAKSVIGRLSPPPSPLFVTTPNTSSTSRSIQTPNEEVYEKQRKESSPPLSKAREEVRAKRAAESALKQLLRDAQERFSTLHRQNVEVEEKNRELQNRLHEAADMLTTSSKPSTPMADDSETSTLARNVDDTKVRELQDQLQQTEQSLQEKAQQLAMASEELERARSVAPALVNDFRQMEAELQELHTVKERLQQVESELATTKKDLNAKKEAEKILNKSLRDALGLLKPLQLYLEDAEQEKKELIKELKAYRRHLMRLERGDNNETTSFKSRSVGLPDEVNFEVVRAKEQLEATVRQLEQENSQLHDALEDLSHNLNVSGVSAASRKQEERLLEELVELNSRYEVTQSKLKDAHIENHALLDALKLRESTEHDLKTEMAQLKQKLKKSESELDNAKQIATTALIKVEELSMHQQRGSPRNQQQEQQSPELVPLQIGGTRRERRVKL